MGVPSRVKPQPGDVAKRNPKVCVERAERYVRIVETLERSGVLRPAGYRLSPPLSSGRELIRATESRSVNR